MTEQQNKLIIFQNKEIRRAWHDDEWYYSLVDVAGALTREKGTLPFKWRDKMILDQKELSSQIQSAAKELHAEEAWLFGSYACNEARADSDVDVLFIFESELPRPKRIAQAYRVMRSWKVAKDIVVYTAEEFAHWRKIEGSLCYNVVQSGVRYV